MCLRPWPTHLSLQLSITASPYGGAGKPSSAIDTRPIFFEKMKYPAIYYQCRGRINWKNRQPWNTSQTRCAMFDLRHLVYVLAPWQEVHHNVLHASKLNRSLKFHDDTWQGITGNVLNPQLLECWCLLFPGFRGLPTLALDSTRSNPSVPSTTAAPSAVFWKSIISNKKACLGFVSEEGPYVDYIDNMFTMSCT